MCILSFAQETDYNIQKGYAAKGYDVVEYFNGKAREGKQQYAITYDSINYKFSSKENLSF